MGKAARKVRGEAQKEIVNLMEDMVGKYSGWQIWQDFIIMSAISIANAIGGPYREEREKEYLSHAQKYSEREIEIFAQMLSKVADAMEQNPDQDFLGELFMALDLANEWHGQFFTPYSVCRAMASISYGKDFEEKVRKNGWVSVNDPACGAGALLLAFANECRRPGHDINYQTSVLFVAQDIDFLAGMMCYIQLSLMGCPGYVVIDNTITHPATSLDPKGLLPKPGSNIWFTPMYFRDVWTFRKFFAKASLFGMKEPEADHQKASSPRPEMGETKTGQLTFIT